MRLTILISVVFVFILASCASPSMRGTNCRGAAYHSGGFSKGNSNKRKMVKRSKAKKNNRSFARIRIVPNNA